MNKVNNIVILGVASVVLLAGCQTSKPVGELSGSGSSMVDENDASANGGMGDSTIRSAGFADDMVDADTAGSLIIYFEYDKSEVSPQYADLLAAHSRRLVGDNSQQLRLEGHADERGSREYNIGLGERRAQAVRRLLLIQGAPSAQISTVSYGEERPAAYGSTESDYEKNRRVELSYR